MYYNWIHFKLLIYITTGVVLAKDSGVAVSGQILMKTSGSVCFLIMIMS